MAVIQLRRGTAAQWTSANTVLRAGELGLETDTNKIKVGDGVVAWNTLDYNVSSGSTVADIIVGADAAASGTGGIAYDGATGTFTYTPPDIAGQETTTSLSIASNVLTYTDEDGVATEIDLNLYLDDTNLARLTSGTMNPKTYIATFTRDDGSTFDVDFSAVLHDPFTINVGADDSALRPINSGEGVLFLGGTNISTTSDLEGNITITNDMVETNNLLEAVTWADVPDDNITESSVVQHQAALTITESQISDLDHYDDTDFDARLATKDTDDLSEGTTNLYYTDARVRAAVSATGSLSYNSSTGEFSYTQPTNVSTFTNDSGYITASSTDTLTNKSGNISQWTNDSAYLTDITGEGLGDLSDVNLTSPADGELLMYNGVSWRNQNELTQKIDFLDGIRLRGEMHSYFEEFSVTGTPGHIQTYSMSSSGRTGYFFITDLEHDMIINITDHPATTTNRQTFSIVVAVDNNNTFGGHICNGLQIGGVTQTVDWGYGNSAPTGTQDQIDVVEFVVYSVAGVGYNVVGRHWQKSGSDVYLVDGGTASSIYTSGDLVLDGGSA
jgi:hypothetical protein